MQRSRPGMNALLCGASALALLACAQKTETPVATPAPAPRPAPPVAAPAPSVDVLAMTKPPAPSTTWRTVDDYRIALAQHILAANTTSVAQGDLDPLLRAIVVLRFHVDGRGNMRNLNTVRTPEREAEGIARTSLSRAGTLPAPPPQFLKNGVLEVTETWLFNEDGRFSLRTLGPRQRSQ